jgi:hypothetical protein
VVWRTFNRIGYSDNSGHRLRPQGFFQEGLPLASVLILHPHRQRLPCSNKDGEVGEKCKEVDFQRLVIGFDFGDGAHELAASGKTAGLGSDLINWSRLPDSKKV